MSDEEMTDVIDDYIAASDGLAIEILLKLLNELPDRRNHRFLGYRITNNRVTGPDDLSMSYIEANAIATELLLCLLDGLSNARPNLDIGDYTITRV